MDSMDRQRLLAIATLRAGRMIAGSLEGMVQADRP
jgi:hypothetical protein